MTSIGPILRARRLELGLTQATVAKALGARATAITVTNVGALSSTAVDYICVGH